MSSLWQWKELLLACGLRDPVEQADEELGESPVVNPHISGISIDTRTLQAGDLFIALSGDPGPQFQTSSTSRSDGHRFLDQAIEKGASALMICRERAADLKIPCLGVNNTLNGLWDLGRFARSRTGARVVAITGSSGKTTARHYIETMLATSGKTHASTSSFNNHWGVPLSLARMPRDSEYGVFEIGMNSPGEIIPLSEMVSPDVAVVLNVLSTHIGFFDSLDGIRKEKLSIINGLPSSGTLVLPVDLNTADIAGIEKLTCVTFGMNDHADVYPLSIDTGKLWRVKAQVIDEQIQFDLKAGGEHRVATALAGFAVLKVLKCNLQTAAKAIALIEPPPGRGNRHSVGTVTVIDDSYNANPVSMRYALESLASEKAGRKIAILGEMLELGKDSDSYHRELAAYCNQIDGVITVGEQIRPLAEILGEKKLLAAYENAAQLQLSEFVGSLKKNDCILVKGSNKVFWVNGFVGKLMQQLENYPLSS